MFLNQLKTALLLGGLSGLFLLLGQFLGGAQGLTIALVIALMLNFFAYFFSDKMVLAMYGAKPLDKNQYGWVYDMVKELCKKAHLPMPKLWYVATPAANAFATGRNPRHSSVAVTQGILDILNEEELRGVLAHEISHIANRDILVGTIAATLATAIGYIAHMLQWSVIFGGRRSDKQGGNMWGSLIIAIFMPIIAMLIQLAISRSREYLADESGAKTCQDPLALASALEKLNRDAQSHAKPAQTPAETATASLFIVYPFSGKGVLNLLSTHPPMEKRIARLKEMYQKKQY